MISSDLGVESSSKIIQELKKSKLLNPSSEKVKEIIKKKLKRKEIKQNKNIKNKNVNKLKEKHYINKEK